jgi:hypothetical protein
MERELQTQLLKELVQELFKMDEMHEAIVICSFPQMGLYHFSK